LEESKTSPIATGRGKLLDGLEVPRGSSFDFVLPKASRFFYGRCNKQVSITKARLAGLDSGFWSHDASQAAFTRFRAG